MSRENCFQGLSYLQHPFLQHPKQKTVDKKIAILRFRNPFEELLDHLKMPQTISSCINVITFNYDI